MADETKVVLITGGSGGIGKATAAKLLALGNHAVTICGRDLTKLETAIAELEPDGNVFHAIQADVTQPEQVERLVASTLAKFGRIDVLINSAGAGHLGAFGDTDAATMERLWNVNVKGLMQVTQAVLPHMVERKAGLIVNMAGVLGVKTIANAALYCATKHAVVGFSGAIAQEFKRSSIRVTSVCCSGVDTPFWEGIPGKPRAEMLLKPDEVAEAIVSLIAQPPHIITNQVLLQHVAHQL